MTATTTWAIPYAISTDRLCDGDDITASMALRVDAIMTAFDADLDFLGSQPAVRLQFNITTTQTQVGGTNSPFGFPFDTVDYDTNNMSNISVDPTTITYRRAGYYAFGGSATFQIPTPTSGAQYASKIFSTVAVNSVCGQSTRDSSDNAEVSCSALNRVPVDRTVPGAEAEIDNEVERTGPVGGGPLTVFTYTNMYAHWIADL